MRREVEFPKTANWRIYLTILQQDLAVQVSRLSNAFFYSFSKHTLTFPRQIKSHIVSQDVTFQISLGILLKSTTKETEKTEGSHPKTFLNVGFLIVRVKKNFCIYFAHINMCYEILLTYLTNSQV